MKNLLIIAWSQAVIVQLGHFSFNLEALALMVSTVLCAAAGYLINDCYDLYADSINKPDKVFINKIIAYDVARRLYFILVFLSLWVGYYVYQDRISYLLLIHLILFLYSYRLKRWPVIGNLAIAFCSAATFYAVLYALEPKIEKPNIDWFKQTMYFSFFAFVLTWIRELVKDLQDKEGDAVAGYRTLAIITSKQVTDYIVLGLSLVLAWGIVAFSGVFGWTKYSLAFTIPIAFGALFFIPYKLFSAQTPLDYGKISVTCKYLMLLLLIMAQIAALV